MLIEQLQAIVGADGWTTDPVVLQPHLTEWREVVRGTTPIMVSPASTGEVARLLKACNAAGAGVVPQGGNTGLCGGAIPDMSGTEVLLSLARLNSIREIDPGGYSMTVEAGCVLADIQQAAADVDRLFPLSLAAEGSCQIGGNLATNAGGINVLRYGTARDLVLGLEVVLADGTILNSLRALRKDTAGYDLKQLFLGSEGTLGIITAASLRLYSRPKNVQTALIALPAARSAVELLGNVRDTLGDQIQAFELISDRAMQFVEAHIPGTSSPFADAHHFYVLIEAGLAESSNAFEAALAAAIDNGIAEDAVMAKSVAEADALWRIRHSISEAQKFEGGSLKHDVSVPVGRIGDFLDACAHKLESQLADIRPVVFGHVGDGNLHYNVSQPVDMSWESFVDAGESITTAIYDLVIEMGGSISAEHGIGVTKKEALRHYKSPEEISLMQTLKKALDPLNTLNPGKVI